MNYSENIKNADWLNESQKKRLLAVYETVKFKDIERQALDMLKLDEAGARCVSPCEYKNLVVGLMQQIPLNGLEELEAQGYKGILWSLYLFFDTLDCDDFYTLRNISDAYCHSDGSGNYEQAIDKLYRATVEENKENLRLLEAV